MFQLSKVTSLPVSNRQGTKTLLIGTVKIGRDSDEDAMGKIVCVGGGGPKEGAPGISLNIRLPIPARAVCWTEKLLESWMLADWRRDGIHFHNCCDNRPGVGNFLELGYWDLLQRFGIHMTYGLFDDSCNR